MARYTPKHRKPTGATSGKPKSRAKPVGAKKKSTKKKAKPGKFACKACEKAFRTEEALATHALDAHGHTPDPTTMAPLKPNMVRCPECGAPVRKRNLPHHLRFIHDSV